MARMPGAQWKPITGNFTPKGQVEVRGVVLHIMVGTLNGTDGWFRNPRSQASSHFGTGKDKRLTQWVDTRDRAWAQADGNRSWLSVENEGVGGDALTDDQLDSNAAVLAWAHTEHGVPLQVATSPSGFGLGHHGMGGRAWGNHPGCPGSKVIAQKPEIVRRARLLVSGGQSGPPWPGRLLSYTKGRPLIQGQDVRTWQAAMVELDYDLAVDGLYGNQSKLACYSVQAKKRILPVDGIVGPNTWAATVQH